MQRYRAALASLIAWLERHLHGVPLLAAGHRVVHGGEQFVSPKIVDGEDLKALHALTPLAPLHQERDLAPIHMLRSLRPQLPQIACFDTAFHATQSPVARAFGLPRQLSEQGVKRYGFHGLSYQYIAGRLPTHLGVKARSRIVVAHLGSGASLCAMRDRKSVATTMGFSALDGLLMGTRGGALDPGVVLFLQDHHGMDLQTVTDMLYHRSGLLGVSGISSSMLELLDNREPSAREAVNLFIYRFRLELGAMAAALGGLEALVFTGGIGQNSSEVRSLACQTSRWLGVEIDEAANAAGGPRISSAASRVSVWMIPTDEERMIAEHALAAVS
jgi:acetate kinase